MQQLKQLSNRFWYQTPVSKTDRPILGLVVGEKFSLMIDAGNSEHHAHLFLEQVQEQNLQAPSVVLLTHWHWDHIFGLSALNFLSIASSETKREMEKLLAYEWTDAALDTRVKEGIEIEFCATAIKHEYEKERNISIMLPAVTFEKQLEMDLGGVTCTFIQVGGDHSEDSVVVYIKEEKVLFLSDSIYPNLYASKISYTTDKTLKLLDALEQFEADHYILSHSGPISKEEFQAEAHLLRTIAMCTEKYNGDYSQIKQACEANLKRSLNEDELDTVQCFINGFVLDQE